MTGIRRQLTLFVDENQSAVIEQVRSKFNPVQSDLIRSHVTLCREDELIDIERIRQNLAKLHHRHIAIDFQPAVRFSDGKGVMIPGSAGNDQFQQLRKIVLHGVIENPRRLQPHITLMHPRNSTCTNSIFEQIKMVALPGRLEFNRISLIDQADGCKWNILQEFWFKQTG